MNYLTKLDKLAENKKKLQEIEMKLDVYEKILRDPELSFVILEATNISEIEEEKKSLLEQKRKLQ